MGILKSYVGLSPTIPSVTSITEVLATESIEENPNDIYYYKIEKALELRSTISFEGHMSLHRIQRNMEVLGKINKVLDYPVTLPHISAEAYNDNPEIVMQLARESDNSIIESIIDFIYRIISSITDFLSGSKLPIGSGITVKSLNVSLASRIGEVKYSKFNERLANLQLAFTGKLDRSLDDIFEQLSIFEANRDTVNEGLLSILFNELLNTDSSTKRDWFSIADQNRLKEFNEKRRALYRPYSKLLKEAKKTLPSEYPPSAHPLYIQLSPLKMEFIIGVEKNNPVMSIVDVDAINGSDVLNKEKIFTSKSVDGFIALVPTIDKRTERFNKVLEQKKDIYLKLIDAKKRDKQNVSVEEWTVYTSVIKIMDKLMRANKANAQYFLSIAKQCAADLTNHTKGDKKNEN